MSKPTFLYQHHIHDHLYQTPNDVPDGVDVDDRVKDGVIDGIVDVPILVIVQPSGLNWQEPGINAFLAPINFYWG